LNHVNVLETDPTFINAMGSIHPLFDMVAAIRLSYERCRTAQKILAVRLPERNILKDLRGILLAANEDSRAHSGNTRTAF